MIVGDDPALRRAGTGGRIGGQWPRFN
jgi:hypothetical protein